MIFSKKVDAQPDIEPGFERVSLNSNIIEIHRWWQRTFGQQNDNSFIWLV